MIPYEKIAQVLDNPPTRDLVDLYNYLDEKISTHHYCVDEDQPLKYLREYNYKGELLPKFCVSATSIQTKYVAFVLGKCIDAKFPDDILQLFWNVDTREANMQFGNIAGEKINGCVVLFHNEEQNFDLQKVYDRIYDL